MGIIKSLAGLICVEITSAAAASTLSEANLHKIMLMKVTYISELVMQVYIYRSDYRRLCEIVHKTGGTIRIKHRSGIYWLLKGYLKRPVLLCSILICLVLTIFLPSRILFVHVDGNTSIPTRLIIEKAESCGISFGVSRRQVRSEQIKNALLSEIPQLQWVGVNTSGCTAVISVRERTANEQTQSAHGVGSIVADRDGIIRELTVIQGNPLCKVGQAVKKGQVLVSAYTDYGLTIKATRAQAEITAQTLRDLTLITPIRNTVRGDAVSSKLTFSLQIGKKLINFSNDSGISDTGCVKMYTRKYLTLPGGFTLPVALICQRTVLYQTNCATSSLLTDDDMSEYSAQYLKSQMLAGQILQQNVSFDDGDDVRFLRGKYNCLEMIGKVVNEELGRKYGENN